MAKNKEGNAHIETAASAVRRAKLRRHSLQCADRLSIPSLEPAPASKIKASFARQGGRPYVGSGESGQVGSAKQMLHFSLVDYSDSKFFGFVQL